MSESATTTTIREARASSGNDSRVAISTLVSRDRHVEMRKTVELMAAEFSYSQPQAQVCGDKSKSGEDSDARTVRVPWYIFSNGSSAKVCDYLRHLERDQPHAAFEFHVQLHDVNLGCGAGINRCWEQTRAYEFVLFLEDDWLLVPESWSGVPRDWMTRLVRTMDSNRELSCVYLRTYVDAAESAFHYHLANNERNGEPLTTTAHGLPLRQVTNFNYSNNPHMRRNADFNGRIYPLPEFLDANGCGTETKANRKLWGLAEIQAEKRMHGMTVFDLNPGIFAHYDHWIEHWDKTVTTVEDDDDEDDVIGCGRYRRGDSRLTCKYGHAEFDPAFCLTCDHSRDLRDLRPHYRRYRALKKEWDKVGSRGTWDIEDLAANLGLDPNT